MYKIIKSCLVAVLFLGIAACNNSPQQQQENRGSFPVTEVQTRTVTSHSTYPATIEGIVNSPVRAKVPGYITQVLVDEGEEVKAGQTLFTLETETLTQDAEAARAEVNAAQVEVNKLEPLVEKEIISSIQLESAKARLAQAKSRYNSVAANIGYATIKSPVNGRVGSINFRSGTLVSPADNIPLTTVSQTSEVYAFFSMNERDYFDFLEQTEGTTLREKLDNFPEVNLLLAGNREYAHPGKIETVNSQVDPQTGTVSFRATFPNPEGILANGNTGRIKIPKTYEDVVVIPSKSTYEAQGHVYAFQLTQGDTVRRRLLEVGGSVQGLYVINKGLTAGDTIVAEGVARVDNNSKIQPKVVEFDTIIKSTETFFN